MTDDVRPTRIAIVLNHALFAETLDLALTDAGHAVRRVPPDQSIDRLVDVVLQRRPEMALLDVELRPGRTGIRLVAPLSLAGVAVVVLTADADPARLGECFHLGARAVVPKSVHLVSLLETIGDVGSGRPALFDEQRERLVALYRRERTEVGHSNALLERLSPREGEILGALMDGTSVVEIARAAFVSETTVRTQVRAIRTKLGVASQLGAVGLAVRAHWRPPRPRQPDSAARPSTPSVASSAETERRAAAVRYGGPRP